MGEKVKQGIQFRSVQFELQMLGKLVFMDMQVEAGTPGAEVMGHLSQ